MQINARGLDPVFQVEKQVARKELLLSNTNEHNT